MTTEMKVHVVTLFTSMFTSMFSIKYVFKYSRSKVKFKTYHRY